VSALAAEMLRLTRDTSPAVVSDVQDRLDSVASQAMSALDANAAQSLLAHGRLLLSLLPETDGELNALSNGDEMRNRDVLHTMILGHQTASRATARHYRLILYVTSLLLVGVLIHLALRLHGRAGAARRRAALERAIMRISMRFIAAQPRDTDAGVMQALAEMAECVNADRAYFLIRSDRPRTYLWCRPGIAVVPGWPESAPAFGIQFGVTSERVFQIADVRRLRSAEMKRACLAVGLRGWALASRRSSQGPVFLGFDAVTHPCRITQRGQLGVLPIALDTLANAVERQTTEAEKAHLEERLRQTRRLETVGALASGIAHSFNNIIGAILGYVEMAEARVASDSRHARNLGEIRRAGERGRDLVDQILTFGRRRNGRRLPISVRNLMAESASLLHASLPAEIDLVFGEAPGAAIVLAEPAQLQQVVLNLCTNAAQAMDGIGRIEVETTLRETTAACTLTHGALAPGRYVLIAVTDSGRGIDPSILERLFEPFFTTRATGKGLGLATVREIMREHGGAINVISNAGEGSRFEAWLPCVTDGPASDMEASAIPFGRGEAVLLIGDAREQLLHDEEILAALGYEPVGFLRVDDAIASCRATPERFNAILIGYVLPAGQAIRLSATLHAIAPELPILIAAKPAWAMDVDALVAAGISEIVTQPIVAVEMAAALVRCLGIEQVRTNTIVTHSAGTEIRT
jgi:signal transduction histidine kinase